MNEPKINTEELVNYVQERLREKGYIIDKRILVMIFNLESDYLIEKGFVE